MGTDLIIGALALIMGTYAVALVIDRYGVEIHQVVKKVLGPKW